MTVKERILTVRLMKKMQRDPEYAARLGIEKVKEDNMQERRM